MGDIFNLVIPLKASLHGRGSSVFGMYKVKLEDWTPTATINHNFLTLNPLQYKLYLGSLCVELAMDSIEYGIY